MTELEDFEKQDGLPPVISIRAELDRVLESSTFSNADRLRAFLSYVVEESIAGRAHLIAGKTISHDVYGRALDTGSDSIVRVDAGRLRRKLSEYYAQEGNNDLVRIHIDSGGYAPRLEVLKPKETRQAPKGEVQKNASTRRGSLPQLLVAVFVLALVAFAWTMLTPRQQPQALVATSDQAAQNQMERVALADKSTATLQAANLAEQASGMLFPIANAEHQKLATSMFREVIHIDPELSDGYAGAGHSLATLALLAPNPEIRAGLLSEAGKFSQKAIDLDPLNGWSQSTAAWVAFANGEYDRAVELSRRAASLSNMDGKTLDFHGVIMAVTGHFDESSRASDPKRARNNRGRHPAHLNIHGVANFHLGNYENAIASFGAAVQQGGPVSELTLVYKAASYQAAGDSATAMTLIAELQDVWPDFRPEVFAERFYQHPANAEQLLTLLRAAGWSAGE